MPSYELPENVTPPDTPGEIDVMAEYNRQIEQLNAYTPTQDGAHRRLGRLGLDDTKWDNVLDQGIADDTNHELRAIIAIARGDSRPLGQIYDEIRHAAEKPLTAVEVNKTAQVARTYDPWREQSPYFS